MKFSTGRVNAFYSADHEARESIRQDVLEERYADLQMEMENIENLLNISEQERDEILFEINDFLFECLEELVPELVEEAIEEAIMECNVSGLTLESVITDGTWYISYFFKNNVDQTTDFEGYNLTFFINGDMNVAGNGNDLDGGWEINSNASERKLEIELDGDLLLDLEEKWKVIEYTTTYVKLRLVGQGNGGNNYMYLSKN